jgi:4-hydroxybenzoate polyprenyltransferase
MDYKFDRENSLYSMATRIGIDGSLRLAEILHFFSIIFFILAGIVGSMGLLYFIGILISAGFMIMEHKLAKKRDMESINKAFFVANGVISFTIFLFGSADIYVR